MLLSINTWWFSLTTVQQFYWTIAILFTVIFCIYIIMMLLGADSDDLDIDLDADVDVDVDADVDADVGSDLHFLSVRGIMLFGLLFGWAGVIVQMKGGSLTATIIVSLLAGMAAMIGISYIVYMLMQATSDGNIKLENAIGETGKVYLKIPANGTGKVTIKIQDRLMELKAQSDETIETGTEIIVEDFTEDGTLIVKPLN
jgi:membrane protein implicated in regulation of membrane protease activity